MTTSERSPLYGLGGALAFVLLLTAWRVLVLYHNAPNISFDEAQYWAWAQTFQFGYYSKPPMVAWAIALTTAACGEGEGCIKLGSTLAHAATALLLYGVGRHLYDRRIGFWAAATFATLPSVALSSMIITTDPFLLTCWAAGLYCLARLRDDDRPLWWVLLGVAFGLGMLAKYAMALFLLSLALYLLWAPERRVWLKSAQRLPLAVAVGLLIYAPNILWNAAHGFVSYIHTKDNANLGGKLFNPGKFLEFTGAQFGVFGPILFAVLLLILFRLRSTARDDRARLLLGFMLPLMAIMGGESFLSRANANWAAPIYVAGSVQVPAWLIGRGWAGLLKASLALHLLAALVLYNYDAALHLTGLDKSARYDLTKRVRGWDEVGREVSALMAQHPQAKLLADERKVMATLIYYVTPHPFDAVKWNPSGVIHDHYDQTTKLSPGSEDYIYVTEVDEPKAVLDRFTRTEVLAHIRVPLYPDYARDVRVWKLSGFKGY